MDLVRICKIDHTNIAIKAERSVEEELRDSFSFFVPGYQFMPKYKHGVWDGKIYLFNNMSKTFPAGLYHSLQRFCDSRGYEIEIDENSLPFESNVDDVTFDPKSYTITSGGNEIEPRDYQIDAVNQMIRQKRGILLSPTGSGKSLMIYMMFRHFDQERFLLVVPTTALVEQMYSDFKDYSEKDDTFDVSDETVHRIYSGKDKDFRNKRLVITTWQSVFRLSPEWFEQFDAVIGDECHTFKAKSLNKIMNSCVNASIRVGTTGTLDGTQINELVLTGLFGPVYRATSTKKLMDNDTLSKIHIDALHVKYNTDECKRFKKIVKKYQEEIAYLVSIKKRNRFLAQLALTQKKNTLMLFNYVEKHGKPLYDLTKEMNQDPDRPIYFISGEIKTDFREEVRQLMENHSNAILIASMGTFSTGINIRNIHNIIFSSPTKSQIRVLQSIGRGLRKHGSDSKLKIYDVIDDFTDGKKTQNFALKHGIERMKIYNREKFDYKTHSIKL